jgi:hypothetical protein
MTVPGLDRTWRHDARLANPVASRRLRQQAAATRTDESLFACAIATETAIVTVSATATATATAIAMNPILQEPSISVPLGRN